MICIRNNSQDLMKIILFPLISALVIKIKTKQNPKPNRKKYNFDKVNMYFFPVPIKSYATMAQ